MLPVCWLSVPVLVFQLIGYSFNVSVLGHFFIDKTLVKYPEYFSLVKKGNKVKIYGLFHLHNISAEEFKNNKKEIENKYQDIFKVFKYKEINNLIHPHNSL